VRTDERQPYTEAHAKEGKAPGRLRLASRARRITAMPMPTITLKLSPQEAAALRRRARAEKKTVSAYVRAAVLPDTEPPAGQYHTKIDRATGLPVVYAPPGIFVTGEQVASLMSGSH